MCIPELMQEWDIEKNSSIGLYPDKITCGSSKKVWWLCKKCGHSWCAIPRSRKDGTGCPVCSRSKAQRAYKNVRLSYNSLSDNRPDLLVEWDYELNRDIFKFLFSKKQILSNEYYTSNYHFLQTYGIGPLKKYIYDNTL